MCLSCGHTRHFRADGSCLDCACKELVTKWPADSIMQPSDGDAIPLTITVAAAAPIVHPLENLKSPKDDE